MSDGVTDLVSESVSQREAIFIKNPHYILMLIIVLVVFHYQTFFNSFIYFRFYNSFGQFYSFNRTSCMSFCLCFNISKIFLSSFSFFLYRFQAIFQKKYGCKLMRNYRPSRFGSVTVFFVFSQQLFQVMLGTDFLMIVTLFKTPIFILEQTRAGSLNHLAKPLPMPLPMPLTKQRSLNSDSLGDSWTTSDSLENHRHRSFSASGDSL